MLHVLLCILNFCLNCGQRLYMYDLLLGSWLQHRRNPAGLGSTASTQLGPHVEVSRVS